MPQRIQRKRTKGWKMPPNTIYVGRPTKWGNPFPVGKEGPMGRAAIDNEGACGFFADMLADPELRQAAGYPDDDEIRRELANSDLSCFCSLSCACHADILLEVANSPSTIAATGQR